jgi:hypothetical protein
METQLPRRQQQQVPALPHRLSDASLASIAKFDDLSELLLDGNDIKTLEGLAPLLALKNLIKIDLVDNPVTEITGYREHLFGKYTYRDAD